MLDIEISSSEGLAQCVPLGSLTTVEFVASMNFFLEQLSPEVWVCLD